MMMGATVTELVVDQVIAGRRVGVRVPLGPGTGAVTGSGAGTTVAAGSEAGGGTMSGDTCGTGGSTGSVAASSAGTGAAPGSGPAGHRPALFLNGACLTSGGWKRVAALLPDRILITVDRPGYRGTPLAEFPTLHAEVRALATILDTLTTDQSTGPLPGMTVVAHSMAAFQAEALARLRPELVGGVVLVDPSLAGPAARKPLAAKTAWQVARAAIGLRPAEGMARAAFRHGLRTQTQRGDLRDEEWEAAWSSAQALAAGAGEWLSYRGQLRELWDLRQRQRGAGQDPSASAGRRHAGATPPTATHYEAGQPGPGEPHSGRRATASAHKAPGSPAPASPVPVPPPAPASPVPAPVPAVMLEAPPYARERDLACLREAFTSLTLVRLPRSRHLMMLDEPGAIAEAVRHLD